MSHYRRESFDEWYIGHFTLQLFELVFDRYVTLSTSAGRLPPGRTKPVPWHMPIRTGWALALPWLSLRWRRPSFRPDRSWGLD
jgi:hypothetical protein